MFHRAVHITALSLDGELLTETFYVYHLIEYEHILVVMPYIYVFNVFLISL
jgi:hypothetical protein